MYIELIDKTNIPLPLDFFSRAISFIENKFLEKNILKQSSSQKINVIFISKEAIKDLNHTYLKKNKVTDILSFAPVEENCLGELALCEDKILEQAKENNLTLEDELFYLLVHGILHLLGFDHEKDEKKAQEMYSIQDSIFEDWLNLSLKTE